MKYNSHTTSLFHYTKDIKAIVGIIENGFYPSYCIEDFGSCGKVAIPMVSFCDIPIDSSEEHIKKYGEFGIGIDKSYLINVFKSTNVDFGPIHYVLNEKPIKAAFFLHKVAIEQEKEFEKHMESGNPVTMDEVFRKFFKKTSIRRNALSTLAFIKPYFMNYQGHIQVNYDECEWRIVYPDHGLLENSQRCRWFWNIQDYQKYKEDNNDQSFLLNAYNANFPIDKINMIIVPNHDARNDFNEIINESTKLRDHKEHLMNKIHIL